MSGRIARMVLWSLLWIAAATQAQTVEYLHTDALGSVVAVTNASRTVLERREYEPYGSQLTPAVTNGPGYTGHVQDAATGLVYMQQRYYDAQIGRFLSMDPVTANSGTGANFNRYWYANNSPYTFTDPTGTESAEITLWSTCHVLGGADCGATPHAESIDAFAASVPFGASAEAYDNGRYLTALGLGLFDAATFGRGSALRTAMREAGVRFFRGEVAHHVVAQGLKDKWSVASRKLMDKMGVDIDDAANGAKVPDWFHQGADNFLHHKNTAEAIYKRLAEASKSGTEAFKKELATIGKEIEKAAKEAKVRTTGSRILK